MKLIQRLFLCIIISSALFHVSETEAQIAFPKDVIILSGSDWWIHDDPNCRGEQQKMYSADPASGGWIPAEVPGNIQNDLEKAHVLGPLWYGDINTDLYEVPQKDWWYRKDFFVPADKAGKRMTLVFDGVEEGCEIWLNGEKIGRNAGMFHRFSFDVGKHLKLGEMNQLAVKIRKMPVELVYHMIMSNGSNIDPKPISFQVGAKLMFETLKDLKTSANFAFDWSTNVWTLGIWKPVWIEFTGPARIKWTRVESTLSDNYTKATVHAVLEIDASADLPAKAEFCIRGHGAPISKQMDIKLKKGHNVVTADIPVNDPALWWPNENGKQSLYTLDATLTTMDGNLIDTRATRFGIREFKWVLTEGAPKDFKEPYQLLVNGRPVRTMGSSLILPYIFPGLGLEHELQLLRFAKEAHFTALRINGGGCAPGAHEFYDLADELGIMISYEFSIGNDNPKTDPETLVNLEKSVSTLVKQTRNHPSIMEYVGGSEMHWKPDNPGLHLMRRIVKTETDRLFRASNAVEGGRHNPHMFDIRTTYRHYNSEFIRSTRGDVNTMNYNEFGTPGPAFKEVWYRDIPLSSQWSLNLDDPVLIHKNATHAFARRDNWVNSNAINWAFGPADNLSDFIRGGQFLAAEGLRYAFEAIRRKGKTMGGFYSHCFSEPWPNAANSAMVDFDGRSYMKYDFVKAAMAPIALSLKFNTCLFTPQDGIKAELYITSDAPEPAAGLRWHWLARNAKGTVLDKGTGTVSIHPIEAKSLTTIELHPRGDEAKGAIFVEARLEDSDGKLLNERIQIFAPAASRFSSVLYNIQRPDRKFVENTPYSPPNLALGKPVMLYTGKRGEEFKENIGAPPPTYRYQKAKDAKTSWFEINLEKQMMIGRFKTRRARTGIPVKSLNIQTSLDGKTWETAFKDSNLAKRRCYSPDKTVVVEIKPVRAQYVRVEEDMKKTGGTTERPNVAQFEVYAPGEEESYPSLRFEETGIEVGMPVQRTSLQVTVSPQGIEGDEEVYRMTVKNTGKMTALLCEPHPLLVYRTDLFIDNKNCFIPPEESRVITIRAPRNSESGLTLAQTGWRITCWNADDLTIAPSADVPLSVGRRDKLCREYAGYFDPASVTYSTETVCKGSRPDTETIPYRLERAGSVRFVFDCTEAQAEKGARLWIHTADQSCDVATVVETNINGKTIAQTLPKGLGIQFKDPAHLAFPATLQFDIPASELHAGENTLTVRVKGAGWFSWDALDLVLLK